MTIQNQNVKIHRGDNAQLKVTLTTSTGTAYDPAVGDEVKYRLSRNADSPVAEYFITKELGSGITIAAGVATIELTAAQTRALEPGIYYHELKIVDPPLEVATAMIGTVIIKSALDMGITL